MDHNEQQLIQHMKKYITLHPDDELAVLSYFQVKTFAKKENLLVQNNRCRQHYFVISGCLRLFFINDKGVEQTTQFAIDNWWMTDYLAFGQQGTTDFTIQAVEQTSVFQIDYQQQEQLLQEFPQLERYFRLLFQRGYGALQLRTRYLYDFSREEIYHHFQERFPDFAKRIPQHLLASYLNMTPEYLSEIKKKTSS